MGDQNGSLGKVQNLCKALNYTFALNYNGVSTEVSVSDERGKVVAQHRFYENRGDKSFLGLVKDLERMASRALSRHMVIVNGLREALKDSTEHPPPPLAITDDEPSV